MATSYTIYLRTPDGRLLTVFDQFQRLDMVRNVSGVGVLELNLFPNIDMSLIEQPDLRLEVHRAVEALPAYIEGETTWLVQQPKRFTNASGEEFVTLLAFDAPWLLAGRIVNYPAGSSQSQKTGTIDDVMKEVVHENHGAGDTVGTPGRDISAYLSIAPSTSSAPTITKAFSRRNVLELFQELAAASKESGTYLAFDIVYVTATTLEFRTYINQRGVNHGAGSPNQLIFNTSAGNLTLPGWEINYAEEINDVTSGGRGEGIDRIVQNSYDAIRISKSVFRHREIFIDSRQTSDPALLLAEATQALWAGRPKRRMTGRLQDTPMMRYGVHYGFGDVITAEYAGYAFDCHIDRVHLTYENGQETIDIEVAGEEVV